MSDEKTPIAKRGPEFDLGDLARAIAERTGFRAATLRLAVDKIAAIVPDVLSEHGSVELPGIGVISLSHRYEKAGDKFTEVTGSMKVRFRPAGDLRREIERLTGFDV